MGDSRADLPNQAAPVSLQQLREALAFISDQYKSAVDGSKNVFVWLWESIQGDFNQDRTAGQIVFDTAISMVPGVDQVCDVRDIIANCKQINDDKSNTWAWIGLVLTLVGLIPTLGSLLKGVLKIFFLFIRRFGLNHLVRAVDETMGWVITLLRRREVAKYWKALRWDRVFHELARQTRIVRGRVTQAQLLKAFDRAVLLMRNLLGKVADIPLVGSRAQETIDLVVGIRKIADKYIGKVLAPVQRILDTIIKRLEFEDMVQRRGIVNTGNFHFSGTLPEAHAVTLMRRVDPPPSWLGKGEPTRNMPLVPRKVRAHVDEMAEKDFPKLTDGQIKSFAQGMRADTIKGPAKLYRVVSPSNSGAGADWMTEEVFDTIMKSSDPKATWRKHLAVWSDWNPNGQFVVYELKAGERLNVWRGPASAQTKDTLPDHHLEGGYEQIKFDAAVEYDAAGKPGKKILGDSQEYYSVDETTGAMTRSSMTHEKWKGLPAHEQVKHVSLRTKINNPHILGPVDTGWGTTDFGSQMNDVRLGLPNISGQKLNR